MFTKKDFEIYKKNTIVKTIEHQKKYPYVSYGYALLKIIQNDFPILIKNIKYSNIDPCDNNHIEEFWKYMENNLINSF